MKNNFLNDCCFLIASSAKKSYQKLSETYSAIEPPTWALLLSQSVRSVGFKPFIIDANAENLDNEQILKKRTCSTTLISLHILSLSYRFISKKNLFLKKL